jgi:hypothetical protein
MAFVSPVTPSSVEAAVLPKKDRAYPTSTISFPQNGAEVFLTDQQVNNKTLVYVHNTSIAGGTILLPTPVLNADGSSSDLNGMMFCIQANFPSPGVPYNINITVLGSLRMFMGQLSRQTLISLGKTAVVNGTTYEFWFVCDKNDWKVIDNPFKAPPNPSAVNYTGYNPLTFQWGLSSGNAGFVQFFPVPLALQQGGVYTDPGTVINRPFPNPSYGFLDNPAHPVTVSNFNFTSIKQPYFIKNWGVINSTFSSAVNYPGYAQLGTTCRLPESAVRQGSLSVSSTTNVVSMAYFEMLTDASFRLGIGFDSVADGTYSPSQISISRSSNTTAFTFGQRVNSIVGAISGTLPRDGIPKMADFSISGRAGDIFGIQFIGPEGSPATMAMCLLAFSAL